MSSIVLLARLLLAVVFVTAAVAKLADLGAHGARSRSSAWGISLPASAARCCRSSSWRVRLRFCSSQQRAGVRSRRGCCLSCSSPGSAMRSPRPDAGLQLLRPGLVGGQISWRTLARNGALLAVAALVVWKGPGSALTAWTSNLAAANLVAGIAVIACALLAVAAIRYRQLSSARAPAATPGRRRPPRSSKSASSPRASRFPTSTGCPWRWRHCVSADCRSCWCSRASPAGRAASCCPSSRVGTPRSVTGSRSRCRERHSRSRAAGRGGPLRRRHPGAIRGRPRGGGQVSDRRHPDGGGGRRPTADVASALGRGIGADRGADPPDADEAPAAAAPASLPLTLVAEPS